MMMRMMTSMIGYVPPAIIMVPCVIAWIRQSLYYKGCMDGFFFVLAAYGGFVMGGMLNLSFLIISLILRRWQMATLTPVQRNLEAGATAVAMLTFLVQVAVVGYIVWAIT